ncbi:MAG: GNAT family N-acetyltransferase [Pyrinomonadaceae bacterium]
MSISDEIKIRVSGPDDAEFLFSLYLERRTPELTAIGWSADEIGSFLRLQYSLRRQAYEARYKNAVFYLIESNGRSVGELITSRTREHILVIDIAISSEYRGLGFGSAAIRNLQAEAVEADRSIILHVDRQNIGARKLYENLGFEIGEDSDQVTFEMTWKLNYNID